MLYADFKICHLDQKGKAAFRHYWKNMLHLLNGIVVFYTLPDNDSRPDLVKFPAFLACKHLLIDLIIARKNDPHMCLVV